jgi:uncharacterized repeat protein (TIGR03803 family)
MALRSNGGGSRCGTVFKVAPRTKKESVLHRFSCGTDGGYPYAGLVLSEGMLYGTTYSGGSGYGVVFDLNIKTGMYTVLHNFMDTDGAQPVSSLTLDSTGNVLFGTTLNGGSSGYGVVFTLSIKTGTYAVLYNFTGGSSDGANPWGTMALDPSGNLYGSTTSGGADYCGTVFELDTTGTETVLHSFQLGPGSYPYGGVVRSEAGKLYGTTNRGGGNDAGTVFELFKEQYTTLHTFTGLFRKDSSYPVDGLLIDASGNLYGTTQYDGSHCEYQCGTVWKLTP